MSAEEYDRDYDGRLKMMNMANLRNDQRNYGNFGDQDDFDDSVQGGYKKRKNMRGRKGKYYS